MIKRIVKSRGSLSEGSIIEVRQTGSPGESAPAKFLAVGSSYLLYLTPSGLSGDLAKQYYVTGVDAGIYASVDSGSSQIGPKAKFMQVHHEDGDKVPTQLILSDAEQDQ